MSRTVARVRRVIAPVVLSLWLGPPSARAQGTNKPATEGKPLSESEIIYMLGGHVTPTVVAALARQRGIDFRVTPEVERELRKFGADDSLLATLRELSGKPSVPAGLPPGEEPMHCWGDCLWVDNGNSLAVTVEETGGGKLCDVSPHGTCTVAVREGDHNFQAVGPAGKVVSRVAVRTAGGGKYVYNPEGKNFYYVKTQRYRIIPSFSPPPPVKEKGHPEWLDVSKIDFVLKPFPQTIRVSEFGVEEKRTGLFRRRVPAPPAQRAKHAKKRPPK